MLISFAAILSLTLSTQECGSLSFSLRKIEKLGIVDAEADDRMPSRFWKTFNYDNKQCDYKRNI